VLDTSALVAHNTIMQTTFTPIDENTYNNICQFSYKMKLIWLKSGQIDMFTNKFIDNMVNYVNYFVGATIIAQMLDIKNVLCATVR
jgi:hypothetical protein